MEKNKIRKAKIEDLDNLLKLVYQLSPKEEGENPTRKELEEKLKKIIKNKNQSVFVYEIDKKIVGTLTLLIQDNLTNNNRDYAHLEYIVVDKKHRNNNIGKELVKYAHEQARKKGCYKAILVCEEKNVHFYKKCGMRETGEVEMRADL